MSKTFSNKSTWRKRMPVNGSGVVTFNIIRSTSFRIAIKIASTRDHIYLQIGKDTAGFYIVVSGAAKPLFQMKQPESGYDTDEKISYWFSYDRDRLVLKYGKGYQMEETTILTFNFLAGAKTETEKTKIRNNYKRFFNASSPSVVELYDIIERPPTNDATHMGEFVEFDKAPFICNLPAFVKDNSKVSLFTLDRDSYMLSGSLPPACKDLYENIKSCELNCSQEISDVLLSDAMRYSIETEGCALNQKLKDKAGGFGSESKHMTYLRVTLGQDHGQSPGIPYVLEIWPSGHFSPIHNHGNSNGIIKVLFGSVNISIYNKHRESHDAMPIMKFNARAGDVTWINRNWFQTHQVRNIKDDFCATLQCYKYDTSDTTRCPCFRYVKGKNATGEFLPNSDFTFKEMRTLVLEEYQDRVSPISTMSGKETNAILEEKLSTTHKNNKEDELRIVH